MLWKSAIIVFVSIALLSFVEAEGPLGLNNVQCQPVVLETSVTSKNLKFVDVEDNYHDQAYISQQILEYTTDPTNWTSNHLPSSTDLTPFNASYKIAGSYCVPLQKTEEEKSLLVAIHGVGFDSTYWDFSYKPEYSFVRQAASYGYSSFIFDRLGCGKSDAPNQGGFSAVQAPTELAITHDILTQLRSSTKVGNKKHNNITLIGHSYGSVLTEAITKDFPDLVQAAVLTGFSTNSR